MPEEIDDPYPAHLTGAIGAAFVLLVNLLMVQKGGLGSNDDYPKDVGSDILDNLRVQFDFIIVGAGAAGCVLANRLSQYTEWKVLLIEAGGDPSPSSEVPAFYSTLQRTKEDWQFITMKSDKACKGMVDKVCRIPKGKVLGGTSSINNLHYMRGNPHDFNNWYNMGNEEWGFNDVKLFYKRLEYYKSRNVHPIGYGTGGEIALDSLGSDHYVKDMIYNAAKTLQYDKLQERHYLGYVDNVLTINGGTRHNMAKAFLTPVKNRRNLFLLKNGYVTKLLIPDVREKRIKGVECFFGDDLIKIKAKREVILSAGALNTPKILMLSGIGPAEHIKAWQLPLVADLKVGENMQEHMGVPVFVGLDKNKNQSVNQLHELIDATYLYMMHREGPLVTTNFNSFVGFLNTRVDPFQFPNILIYHYHFVANDINLKGFLGSIGYAPEIEKSVLKHNQNQTLVMFLPTILKPKSRGKVLLNTTSPLLPPLIHANFFSDEDDEDLMTLVSGYKYIMRMIQTTPFVKHKAELLHIDIPDCRNYKFPTNFFIKCHIKNLAYPQGDVVGTTRMGPICDDNHVLDEDLLVKDVRGLRIVDASFMPEIVSANIQGTVAMAAEKVADRIKLKWSKNYKPKSKDKCTEKCNL